MFHQVEHFFVQRNALEARRLRLADLVRQSAPPLNRALEEVERLRRLNRSQVRQAQAYAAQLDTVSRMLGISASIVLLLGLTGLLVGLRWYVLKPLLEIERAIADFQGGASEARVAESGGREVRTIAHAFNELTAALALQRQNQLAFLAGVAHDLRSPLSALKLKMQALVREKSEGPEKASASLALIDRQIDRLSRMVNDLLDATRIEAGNLQLDLADVDLRDAAREVVNLYAPTSPVHHVALKALDQPVRVMADALRIEQVVSNLISNAMKYSPGGGPINVEVGTLGSEAFLLVQDRGIGIPPEEIADIFLPFRRRAATQDSAPGTGLGLSVVRRIVTAHGGHIEVESTPGRGSTFKVWLPRDGGVPASV